MVRVPILITNNDNRVYARTKNMKIKCGSQLYTYRNVIKTEEDLRKVFDRLNDYGCTVAQWSGVRVDISKDALKEIVKESGISIPLSHTPWKKITEDTDRVAEWHAEIGAHTVGLGMMKGEYLKSLDKLNVFCDKANEIGEKLKSYGLSFGYHNHSMEFKKMGDKLVIEHLRDNCPNLQFIFDTFWCKYAGYDPSEWILKLGDRVRDIHLKDWKPSILKLPRFQDVGKGELDFESILKNAERAGTESALIEHDTTRNPDKTTKESMEYLKEIYLSK